MIYTYYVDSYAVCIYIYAATLLVINFVDSFISFCSPRKCIQHHSVLLRSLRWEASTHSWGNLSAFGGFRGSTTKSCWTRNTADLGLESWKFLNVMGWAIHNLWPFKLEWKAWCVSKQPEKCLLPGRKSKTFILAGFLCVTPFPLPNGESTVDESRKAQCLTQTSLNRGRLVPEVTLAFLPSQQCSTSCCWSMLLDE